MQRDTIHYYIWDGESREGYINTHIDMPDNSKLYLQIKKLPIEKGDFIFIDYGKNIEIQTLQGSSLKAEFPYGRGRLCGIDVYFLFQEFDMAKTIMMEGDINQFERAIINQTNRMQEHINNYKNCVIEYEMARRNKNSAKTKDDVIFNKGIIKNALQKMENIFR